MLSWILITWLTVVLGLGAAVLQDVVGDVRNLTVSVVAVEDDEDEEDERAMVFEDEPMLRLNVSWLPPEGDRKPSFYSVSITSAGINTTASSSSCLEGSLYYVGQDVNQTRVLLPENRFPAVAAVAASIGDLTAATLDELDVEPGCAYRVQVFANPRNNLGAPPSIIYTVPQCVGGRCSCDGVLNSLPTPIVNSRVLHNGSLQVSWRVDDSPKRAVDAVEAYKVSVGIPHLTSSSGLVVYNKTVIYSGSASDHSFVWDEEGLKKGTKIFVAAQDLNGCSGREGSCTVKKPRNHLSFYHKNVTAMVLTGLMALFLLSSGIFSVIGYVRKHRDYKTLSLDRRSPKQLASVLQNPRIEALLKNHNILYVDQEIEEAKRKDLADAYEIPYRRLRLERELGQGQFGRVYLAHLEKEEKEASAAAAATPVAVKMSLTSSDSARVQLEIRQQLLEEIAITKIAGAHPHLVAMIGCCTLPSNPVCLVLEYMRGGDLLGYLHRMRDGGCAEVCCESQCGSALESPGVNSAKTISTSLGSLSPSTPTTPVFFANNFKPENEAEFEAAEGGAMISHAEMTRFALEIARGMEHLEAKGIVHRDLAARNVLMDEHLVLKISDFGLSRRGVYMLNGGGTRRLPIRWMPPEAIRRRAFTSKSDVWSYGIVLWEIASLGDFPYSHVADGDLLRHLLEENGRPEEVRDATPELSELMDMCWAGQPERRPNFKQVVMWLENKKEGAGGCNNNLVYQDVAVDGEAC